MPRRRARRALIAYANVSNNMNMYKKKETTYIHGNKRTFLFQITEGYN